MIEVPLYYLTRIKIENKINALHGGGVVKIYFFEKDTWHVFYSLFALRLKQSWGLNSIWKKRLYKLTLMLIGCVLRMTKKFLKLCRPPYLILTEHQPSNELTVFLVEKIAAVVVVVTLAMSSGKFCIFNYSKL